MFSVLLGTMAASTALLQPTGQWNVDFGETQCAASREYKDARGTLEMAIRQSPYNDVTHLFLLRNGSSDKLADQSSADLRIGTGPIERSFVLRYGAKVAGAARIMHRLSLSPEQMGRLAVADNLDVRSSRGSVDVRLALKQMGRITKLLDDCTRDLRLYWNMGEASSVVAVPPEPDKDVRTVFSAGDYPAEAMRMDLQGSVQVMLLVDETGKTRSCEVVAREGAPVFEAMVCQILLERAKFTPAKDIRGKPLRATYMAPPIRFQLFGN